MITKQFTAERKFGVSLGGALMAFSVFVFFKKGSYSPYTAGAGVILFLSAILIPSRLAVLRTGWLKIGWFLGQVNMIVLLSILYWICITPMGFLLKLFGKDLLDLRFDHAAETHWKDRVPEEDAGMKRQF